MKETERKRSCVIVRRGLLGVLVWILVSAGPAGSATDDATYLPALSISLEKTKVFVGEMLWLTLSFQLPEGARLPEDVVIDGLESLTVMRQIHRPGEIRIQWLVDRLQSFTLGPVSLAYIDDQGKEQHVQSPSMAVTVRSNLGDKPDEAVLKPIQDILPAGPGWIPYLLAAAGAALTVAVVYAWIAWRRKRRRRSDAAAMEDPPHLRAEKEIAGLLAGGLFETGQVKSFYFMLSAIIRRYMESIRQFPAAEMTTEEIGQFCKGNRVDQTILPLLKQADLVKFADSMPAPDRKDRDVLSARTYIQQTRPAAENAHPDQLGGEVRQ